MPESGELDKKTTKKYLLNAFMVTWKPAVDSHHQLIGP